MPEDTLMWAVQKWLNRSRCRLGCGLGWAQGSMCYMECTLAQPGEYDWSVHVRVCRTKQRRCGLMPNYFDYAYLFLFSSCLWWSDSTYNLQMARDRKLLTVQRIHRNKKVGNQRKPVLEDKCEPESYLHILSIWANRWTKTVVIQYTISM